MQTHVVELTKQRLSDFFVKEEGHVAHKNALVAGTVATGAVFAALMLAPNTTEAHWDPYPCGNIPECDHHDLCVSGKHDNGGGWWFACL